VQVQDGDQRGVLGLVAKQRVERRPRRGPGCRVGLRGDLDQQLGIAVLGPPPPRPDPVETYIGRDPEQQRRRRLIGQLVGPAQNLDKDIVHGVAGSLFVPQELPAPPEHHRAVGAVVGVGIDGHRGRTAV
jgi:hypothetical protein